VRNICDICLHHVQPRLEVEAARDVIGTKKGMKYFTYPKLSLSGFLNKEEVSGEAWFDHQWGDFSWFLPTGSERMILSWEWFGINLENGTDWVLMVHRDAQSREPFAKHLTIRNKDGSVFFSKNFNLKSLRNWVSKKTYITYPLEWRIEVPELDANLIFSPVADDQEIPVFGLMRSVWQGAGKISGSIAGISVSGRARGEFQGYGYIFDFKDFLKSFGDRVERHIEEFLPKVIQTDDMQKYVGLPTWEYEPIAYTKLLSEPTWDLILRGGKRWRPVIGLLLLDALGKQPDPYESLVCVLAELIHTGSLIIDDIEDASLLRRGDECIHLRYGQDVAINAANTIYFLPTILISEHPCLSKMQRLKILEVMMRQFVRAHFGQTLDLYWAQNMNLAYIKRWLDDSFESKILQMYQFKTASPIEGLAETACIISGTDKKTRDACINFVNAFGVAFQIVDDIHNFSSSPQWRKLYGEDLAEGKITYVIYHALMNLKKSDQYRLMEILCSKELRKDPDVIREGAGLVQKSRVFEKCREEAKALVEPKWEMFSELIPSSEPKTLLQALFRSLLDQDFQ
ncbi:MAG: polyprenyl synthetase family protein, partial [Candidatus Aminicenantes bacterium]|nr:polyprenyl synthetase family protein [Candidatus Aminicenantes bacterium]